MNAERRSDREGVAEVDFSVLYDEHPDYVARRTSGSFEQAQVDIEVRLFKLPQLMRLIPPGRRLSSVLEIGCATGELISAIPVSPGGRRLGVDISAANVAAAAVRFPEVEFRCGDAKGMSEEGFDAVVISDVLEHVPDDVGFLRSAAALAEIVLVNLPLEDNWLNRWRDYGPDDVSGHLRRYSLAQGLDLFSRAGLDVTTHAQVWVHETTAEAARRALRRERLGTAFSGGLPQRLAKRALVAAAGSLPFLGRRLFASNLFVAASKRVAP